tara:strand:- start:254 stop:574 length:321 start_codon:yes stop_codon:yes gene_type:complete
MPTQRPLWLGGLLTVAAACLLSPLASSAPLPQLSARNGRLVDDQGHEVLLRGTSCDFNFQAPHMTDAEIGVLAGLGWNFVRSPGLHQQHQQQSAGRARAAVRRTRA